MYGPLKISCYFTYFVVGLLITVPGPLIPAMRHTLSLSHGQVGQIFLAQAVGFVLAVLAGGVVTDRLGRRPVFLFGTALLATSLLGFPLARGWGGVLVLFGLVGAGFGLTETALNSLGIDLSPGEEGKGLNLLHLFAAAGGVSGPYLSAFLVSMGWSVPFTVVGLLMTVASLSLWVVTFPNPVRSSDRSSDSGTRALLKNPIVLGLAATIALYVGVENSITGWTVSYAVETLAAPSAYGAFATSLFWIGLTVGRALCSGFTTPRRYLLLLMTAGIGALAVIIPVALTVSAGVTALVIGAAGLFLGGVFPTIFAMAGTIFPHQIGTLSGLLLAACTLGGAAIPALVGLVADETGLRTALVIVPLTLAFMVATTFFSGRAARRAERSQNPKSVSAGAG